MTFQSNGFQSNAFQSVGFAGGAPTSNTGAGSQGSNARAAYLKWKRENKHKYKKRLPIPKHIKEMVGAYNQVLSSSSNPEQINLLIPVIDPYLRAINREEEVRRLATHYIVDTLPPARRIDFERLFGNALAIEKLDASLRFINDANARIIQERLEIQYNEESDMMIMILASL